MVARSARRQAAGACTGAARTHLPGRFNRSGLGEDRAGGLAELRANAVNLGFIGDTTANLLWRVRNGEVAGIAPKVAVLLIGANNLGRVHWSASDTVAGIDMIIDELRHRLPETQILLLGILPSERSAWVSETTQDINNRLAAKYKNRPSVTYLDLTGIFMRNGSLNRALFLDPQLRPPDPPLHPSAQGQMLMSQTMEPMLTAMLRDAPHK